MKYLLVILLFLSFRSTCAANDVYLRTGFVYKSVKIDTSGTVALIDLGSRIDTVQKSLILKNERTPYHLLGTPRLVAMTPSEEESFREKTPAPTRRIAVRESSPESAVVDAPADWSTPHSNAAFLTIGVLGAVIAWDQFTLASNYPSGKDKTRAIIVGVAAAVVCVTFTVYALTPVSVSVSPNKLNVALKF